MEHSKKNEIYGVILLAIGVLALVSLLSFDFADLRIFTSKPNVPMHNIAGIFGAYIGLALFFVMGFSAYVIPLLIFFWALARFWGLTPQKFYLKITGTLFLILASSTLFSMLAGPERTSRFANGGAVGLFSLNLFLKYFGTAGTIVIISVLFLLSILLATEFLLLPFLSRLITAVKGAVSRYRENLSRKRVVKRELQKKPLKPVFMKKTVQERPAPRSPKPPPAPAKKAFPERKPERESIVADITAEDRGDRKIINCRGTTFSILLLLLRSER